MQKDLKYKVEKVQLDINKGEAINFDVIKHLCVQLQYLHKRYTDVNSSYKNLKATETLKKPTYEVGLKIRARKMEFDLAARTGSTPREKVINPGNLAAHGADGVADAHMVNKYDPKTGSAVRGRSSPGFREQYENNYLFPPEITLSFSVLDVSHEAYFSHFICLMNWYENLRLWQLEGIVGPSYAMLRTRVKDLITLIYPLEQFVNSDEFEGDDEVMNEFVDLMPVMTKLEDAHVEYRANLGQFTRKGLKRA
ncbi:hypothetical protein NHQ30_005747 [Ciborinia camelliae]|nr:hypothetical protein NHQ30_005747 [Ciborinia camelliae]